MNQHLVRLFSSIHVNLGYSHVNLGYSHVNLGYSHVNLGYSHYGPAAIDVLGARIHAGR
jgi:hypothetical protein